jgi:hypothetical protein
MPTIAEMALAVSSSEETMKSTSISRSRHASRYARLLVRTTTCAFEMRLTSIALTRLSSSRGLHAISRSASAMPALRSSSRAVPSPSTVRTS